MGLENYYYMYEQISNEILQNHNIKHMNNLHELLQYNSYLLNKYSHLHMIFHSIELMMD